MHLKSQLANNKILSNHHRVSSKNVKSKADNLALMDVTIHYEDLRLKIFNGLLTEFYNISFAVRARETSISFE